MIWGTTFSHYQVRNLGLSVEDSLNDLIALQFDYIRLCSYWNESQLLPGHYDFSSIKSLLDVCEEKGQKVVLTIGMKAPRYPEFYIPAIKLPKRIDVNIHLAVLEYINILVKNLKNYKCISYWQVENEPINKDYSTGLFIPETFLSDEVELLRSLDERPVVISTWGNDMQETCPIPVIDKYADICGVDLYFSQYMESGEYEGPRQSDLETQVMMLASESPIWITELQSEPWEKDNNSYLNADNPSFNPSRVSKYVERALTFSPEAILFWGYEYWYYQMVKNSNDSYLSEVKKIIGK